MKKNTLLFTVLIALLSACVAGKKDIQATVELQGLASPIRLQLDTTEVLLTDYFPDPSKIECAVERSLLDSRLHGYCRITRCCTGAAQQSVGDLCRSLL